jgi:hypothetical protein
VRDGYLGVLASRTLGTAPVLQPVTPSRFEPEGPQPALHEMVVEHEDTSSGSTRIDARQANAAPPSRTVAAPMPDGPLLGIIPPTAIEAGPPVPAEHGPVVPSHAPDELPWPSPRHLEHPARPDPRSVEPVRAAPTADPATAPLVARPSLAWALEELVDPTATNERAPGGFAPEAAGSRHDVRSATALADGGQGHPPEPSIVVRIGRVDVRAVQAVPPPAPARRPPPARGPSLAEHLLARDRGQR